MVQNGEEHKQKILAINPAPRISGYGPAAVYASTYKTAYSIPYLHGLPSSLESGALYNGFFVFGDYPHACRYSIRRGPFLLADIRLKYPEWTVYPEMYTPFGEPCPDAAAARAWPGRARLRLALGPDEFAVVTIANWEIVPPARLGTVLKTDETAISAPSVNPDAPRQEAIGRSRSE